MAGRIQVRVPLKPVAERERFAQLIQHALKTAGCQHTLLAEPGMELLRLASQGLPRQAGRILRAAMQRAVPKGINHLPDDLLQETMHPENSYVSVFMYPSDQRYVSVNVLPT